MPVSRTPMIYILRMSHTVMLFASKDDQEASLGASTIYQQFNSQNSTDCVGELVQELLQVQELISKA